MALIATFSILLFGAGVLSVLHDGASTGFAVITGLATVAACYAGALIAAWITGSLR
jgi:hypothetical protein